MPLHIDFFKTKDQLRPFPMEMELLDHKYAPLSTTEAMF